LRLMPLLKEAGISPKTILVMLKLGELDSLSDAAGLAEDRMREVIEKISATDVQVLPQFGEDHEGMLAFGLLYVMSKEFKEMDSLTQDLIRQHLRLRAKAGREDKIILSGQDPATMAAQTAQGAGSVTPPPVGGPSAEAVPAGATSAGPGAVVAA
jgi:hypothetical protein